MSTLRTLPEALADAARADTGYCFVSAGSDRRRSFAEIRDASLRVARALRDAGLDRGDVAALVIPDSEQFLTSLLGASIAGLIPASLYPPASTNDLARYLGLTVTILNAAGARAVVTTRALAPAFEAARGACPQLRVVLCRDDLDAEPFEPDWAPSLDDIAFIQFTSGSTSSPKGVALTHANLSANVDAFRGPSGVAATAADVGVSWLPLNHDMGLVGMAIGSLYSATECVLLAPHVFVKRPVEWLRAITRYRGTISFAPNFAYDLCVRRVKDLSGLDLSGWRIAGCGAEPIHPQTLAAFADKFAPVGFADTSFFTCYGLAEHVLAATLPARGRPPRTDQISAEDLTHERIAVPHNARHSSVALVGCGVVLPGHRIKIVDEGGRALPERHVGEILLAGPSVMLGYYGQRTLTDQTVRGGWLHTGDLGYLAEGELFVCGRAKDVIIVHGRKYHPQDLEWAVEGLPGVRRGRVVAFGAAESGRADRVVIIVEPSGTTAADVLTDTIRRQIGDLFGLYVDEVALAPSGTVERTTSGKVQRAATKARYERGEIAAEGLRA
jgi:fatty-acyl-CoA synthase